jgi:hypothetical protein
LFHQWWITSLRARAAARVAVDSGRVMPEAEFEAGQVVAENPLAGDATVIV